MREAIVTLSDEAFDAMGLGELVRYVRAAGIEQFEEIDCTGDAGIIQLEVQQQLDGERLAAFEAVDDWELVTATAETYRYIVAVTAPAVPEAVGDHVGELVGTCDATMTDDGATLSLVGPQERISEALRAYETTGVSPELDSLADYEGDASALDSLTDRQREVVRLAYEMGFYDVPRETSTEEIAAALGIDDSTVAEHLQRAERTILTEQLSG